MRKIIAYIIFASAAPFVQGILTWWVEGFNKGLYWFFVSYVIEVIICFIAYGLYKTYKWSVSLYRLAFVELIV